MFRAARHRCEENSVDLIGNRDEEEAGYERDETICFDRRVGNYRNRMKRQELRNARGASLHMFFYQLFPRPSLIIFFSLATILGNARSFLSDFIQVQVIGSLVQ